MWGKRSVSWGVLLWQQRQHLVHWGSGCPELPLSVDLISVAVRRKQWWQPHGQKLSPSLACFNGIWLNSCAFWGNQTFPGLCASPFNQANAVVWSCKGSLSMICSSDYQNHFVVCCCSASILQDVSSKSLCYCVFWGGTDLLNRSNIHFPITAEILKTWFWNCKKN